MTVMRRALRRMLAGKNDRPGQCLLLAWGVEGGPRAVWALGMGGLVEGVAAGGPCPPPLLVDGPARPFSVSGLIQSAFWDGRIFPKCHAALAGLHASLCIHGAEYAVNGSVLWRASKSRM